MHTDSSLAAVRFPWRVGLLWGITAAALAALALHGPIAQPVSYHAFADERTLLGIPNFWNVVSNLPFVLLGLAGLWRLRRRPPGVLPGLAACHAAFFAGAVGIGLGSAWYHLRPDSATLAWDRLPMTVAFMAFFAIVLGEHLGVRLARRALPALLLAGLGSVLYWVLSERLGGSDLRPYLLVQFLPVLLTPLILLLFPSRLTRVGWLWLLLALYVVAKGVEHFDAALYEHLGGLSGHTLKHLLAAGSLWCMVAGMSRRRPRAALGEAHLKLT
ncbi:ceramidase domain-containing protein [Azohydromonas aeria]|uniref:ceramidase domain-containing protein n=1 Tax=Azohydromonas aeria TaxID=2590212 RepID=UPI0012F9DAE8|nr:ceramidase domain-containing protein [Azohydromonas aeria]